MTSPDRNIRGIGYMIAAMAFFVTNDSLIKVLRQELEAGQILLLRGCFSVSAVMLVMVVSKQSAAIASLREPALIWRGALEGVIALLFITALGLLTLGDVMALLMLAPVLVTALSVFLFRETVGWRRWTAVGLAFFGVLLVVQPGQGAVSIFGAVCTLLSAVGVAYRDATTRRIQASISTLAATLATTLGTMCAGIVMVLAGQGWKPVVSWHIGYALLAAIVVSLGNYCIIEAHRDSDLSVVAPFRYSVVVMAVALGALVFGEWPGLVSGLGVALITASGIYTAHRESVRARDAKRV